MRCISNEEHLSLELPVGRTCPTWVLGKAAARGGQSTGQPKGAAPEHPASVLIMDWHLQREILIAKARTLIDESRALIRASRGLKTEARFRVQRGNRRAMENDHAAPKTIQKQGA